jgi:hypothetical protein
LFVYASFAKYYCESYSYYYVGLFSMWIGLRLIVMGQRLKLWVKLLVEVFSMITMVHLL